MSDERPDGLVEMVVESVRVQTLTNQHLVILKERSRERYLPIFIGPWEASAIAMRLQGMSPERPMTHDTFVATLEAGGIRLLRIVIAALADETFHARLLLESGGREIEVDSRPSDALALALRVDARIFANREVLARAGIQPDPDTDESDGLDLERTGEDVPDEALEIFRDFVNSLEVDPGDERREGPGPEGGQAAG